MNMVKKILVFIKNNFLLVSIAVFSFISMINAIEANENSERAYNTAFDAATYSRSASSYARDASDYAEDAANYSSEAASNAEDAASYASEAADAANQASLNAMLY